MAERLRRKDEVIGNNGRQRDNLPNVDKQPSCDRKSGPGTRKMALPLYRPHSVAVCHLLCSAYYGAK